MTGETVRPKSGPKSSTPNEVSVVMQNKNGQYLEPEYNILATYNTADLANEHSRIIDGDSQGDVAGCWHGRWSQDEAFVPSRNFLSTGFGTDSAQAARHRASKSEACLEHGFPWQFEDLCFERQHE